MVDIPGANSCTHLKEGELGMNLELHETLLIVTLSTGLCKTILNRLNNFMAEQGFYSVNRVLWKLNFGLALGLGIRSKALTA